MESSSRISIQNMKIHNIQYRIFTDTDNNDNNIDNNNSLEKQESRKISRRLFWIVIKIIKYIFH